MGMYIWILIFFTRPHKVVGLDYSLMFKNMYLVYKIWMKTKQFHSNHEQSHIFTKSFTQVKKISAVLHGALTSIYLHFLTRVTDFADKEELFVVSAELQTDVKHLLNWKRVFKRIKRKISHNSVKLCREEEILLVNNCNHCLQKWLYGDVVLFKCNN